MNDLESYLNRCYDLLLQEEVASDDAELCACAKLVENDQ